MNMDKIREITPVRDNTDKHLTYRVFLSKYNKAIKEGFYFEALLIDYALIEDRLRSYLYYLGLLTTRNSFKIDCKKAKTKLKPIIEENKTKKENSNFTYTMSGKIKIIRCTLLWAEKEALNENDSYLKTIREQYDKHIDVGGMLDVLQEIQSWCKYRNEVIHALLNKNANSQNEGIEYQAVRGMELARFLDNQVKCLKKNNRIRRSINLSNK